MTTIEQDIEAAKPAGPSVELADIEANIVAEYYFSAEDGLHGSNRRASHHFNGIVHVAGLERLTFCVLVLRNGFMVTGESACVSPENFNANTGREIARKAAIGQVWTLMGYELRSKLVAEVTA